MSRSNTTANTATKTALHRAVYQAASLLLSYPDETWPHRLTEVRQALRPLPGPPPEAILRFCEETATTPLLTLAATYVTTFDRSPRRTLHLTYYTDGDTRRRGTTLTHLKTLYRTHGWTPAPGELPDHLPTILEFAARAPNPGQQILHNHRPALELLRIGLTQHHSPYTHILTAICLTLPGPSPTNRATALRMAHTSPPTETVGLDLIPQPQPGPGAPKDLTPQEEEEEGARR